MGDENIWKKALLFWGREAQLFMVVEELSELQKAISKVYRNPTRQAWLNVIEEMVDTEIMKNQLFELAKDELGIDYGAHYDRIYKEKMERLESRLKAYEEATRRR